MLELLLHSGTRSWSPRLELEEPRFDFNGTSYLEAFPDGIFGQRDPNSDERVLVLQSDTSAWARLEIVSNWTTGLEPQ